MLHPIVASMQPNEEQIPAIVARGRDVVVTAGAGTGKTRTLVARYLALLAEGLPTRSVVAVTFTRKAAHEMRNRAREAVRAYLARPGLEDAERARWSALYGQLDAARIGTIHTLCAEILRAHPVEAARCGEPSMRVDPGFDVLDEAQAALLQEQAVDLALGWAAGEDDIAPLFGLARERVLREGLLTMLRARLAVADCDPGWASPCWADWEARLTPPIEAFVNDPDAREAFAELCALRDDGALSRAAEAGDPLVEPLRALLAQWDAICVAGDAGDWQAVCACLSELKANMPLNKGRQGNWSPARPKDALRVLRGIYEEILEPLIKGGGLSMDLDRRLADCMPGLARLHERVVAEYDALREERRALDFDDLERLALDLLRGDAGVRARWRAEVAALLVDEFQDTNGRQRDLLHLLNHPAGKLFVVGDAKQSIYAFRGADVTVFRQEREDVGREGGCVLSLDVSYRAHQALVDGLNALLCPVLGVDADSSRPWAEPFAPLNGHRQTPAGGLAAPYIELHLTSGPKAEGSLDRAADAVAARLRELVEGGARPDERDGEPRLGYGDAAILCRASSSFAAYEDALDRAGIPYVTVAGRGFHERPEVRDVLNLLRALADPEDDLALAGALRSPVMGLSDAAVYRLCQERRRRGEAASLWDVLVEVVGGAPDGGCSDVLPDEAACAAAAAKRLTRLRQLVGRASVADVLKALYDDTGYPAVLTAAGQGRGSRNLAKLLDDAHRSGLVGVGEFLEYVERLRDVGAREGEARALSEGAVQIMSVHAAKGLEFPVVVLGDVTHQRRGRDGVIVDPELGPLLPVKDDEDRQPMVVRLAKRRLDDQEAAESGRLFYVAATRARELLILNGCVSMKGQALSGVGEWLAPLVEAGGTDLGHVAWDYDQEGARALREEVRIGATPAACCLYEPGWRPEASQPGLDPFRRSGRREETRPASQGPSRPFGTTEGEVAQHRGSERSAPWHGAEPWPATQGPSRPFGTTEGGVALGRGSERSAPWHGAEPWPATQGPSHPFGTTEGGAGMRGSSQVLPNLAMLEPVAAGKAAADEPSLEQERRPARRVWRVAPADGERRAPAWVVGNIVHAALAQWRFDDPHFAAWAETQARRYGLTDRERIDHARSRSRRLLERLRGHRLCADMEAGRPRWHEIPYSVEWNGVIDVGVIDVLYRGEGGWTVVDVKTDHLADGAAVEEWITKRTYVEQMARYRRAVETLVGETPRTLLCFLDVAGAVHLEWLEGG